MITTINEFKDQNLTKDEFHQILINLVLKKLKDYFGSKLDTSKPILARESHAKTFESKVYNAISDVLTDQMFAGYLVEDCHGDLSFTERDRLKTDIENCENIVLFLVDKLYF